MAVGVRPTRLVAGLVALSLVALQVLMASGAFAHGSCTGERMKSSGKRCRAIARCYISEARGRGDAAPCIAEQLGLLERNFHETLIFGDCHEFGDPGDIVAALDAQVTAVATTVALGADRCSRWKMEAAGKLCLHLLRDCEAPAEVEEVPVDPACVDEKNAMLAKLFQRGESKGECTTVDDETNVGTSIAEAVEAVVTELTVP